MNSATWCLRRYFRTSALLADKAFVDALQLRVQAGSGGKGRPSVGGQGGDGGSVFFKGNKLKKMKNLSAAYQDAIIKADDGKNSENPRILGSSGEDLVVQVPLGVTISSRNGRIIGEINETEDVVCVAQGGKGGGPTNGYRGRRPPMSYVYLDLKLVADVGLVGFPNAGKSTLLTRLSNAQPTVASLPFTTLQPQLGVLTSEEEEKRCRVLGLRPRQITIADLPGLVEGAHRNVGLGYEFLKHVERTKVLLFVIDTAGFNFGTRTLPHSRDPFQTICLLFRELELYNSSLPQRPSLLCVNKVEDAAGVASFRRLVSQLNDFRGAVEEAFPEDDELSAGLRSMSKPVFHAVHAISAQKRINLRPVAQTLFDLLMPDRDNEKDEEEVEGEGGDSEGCNRRKIERG